MGWLIDFGVGVERIAAAAIAIIFVTVGFAFAPTVRSAGKAAKG